jgi:hypothetical protein
MSYVCGAYRIEGGLPAGISTLPGLSGCLKNSTKTNTTTISGNKSTTTRGTLIVFSRMRRRINSLMLNCRARCDTSLKVGYVFGREGEETLMFLRMRDRNPIKASL